VREVWINDETVLHIDWMGTRDSHSGVQVWVGDSFEAPADAQLKNVKWTNLGSTPVEIPEPEPVEGAETPTNFVGNDWYQVQGSNYVGDIDVAADYMFETDLMLDEHYDFSSLCRFTITNGNWGTYGDEILNIDITSWNEIFIAFDTLDWPDIY